MQLDRIAIPANRDDEPNPQVLMISHPFRQAVGQELGHFAGGLSLSQEQPYPTAHVVHADSESRLAHDCLLIEKECQASLPLVAALFLWP
jgi:hypothetical protein